MQTLFDSAALEDVTRRLDSLSPDSARLWGAMTPAQMMAHCSAGLEMAVGQNNPPRLFIGRILGPFFKNSFYDDTPTKKSSPTANNLIISDDRDFKVERERLKTLITLFSQGGEAKCTRHPHSFFGSLTPDEWGKGMYKHLDHHFRQFGV